VHDVDAETVHFHEVGAPDTIADVVEVCTAVQALDVGTAVGSPVTLAAIGRWRRPVPVPVPVPAVVALLADAGARRCNPATPPYEMCIPGCAGRAKPAARRVPRRWASTRVVTREACTPA
jgi:uncharacterized protein (DUF111 family)